MALDVLGPLQLGADLFKSIANPVSQYMTNQQNLALQREEWQREDTAMQRKVADLKAAGLNPVLAAEGGGSPSSLAVRVGAPEFSAPDFSRVYQASIQKAAAAKSDADAEAARYMAKQRAIENASSEARLPYVHTIAEAEAAKAAADLTAAIADARRAVAEANMRTRDDEIFKRLGVTSNISGTAGQVANAAVVASNLISKTGVPTWLNETPPGGKEHPRDQLGRPIEQPKPKTFGNTRR